MYTQLALNIRSSINQRDHVSFDSCDVNAKLRFLILKIVECVSEQFASLRRLFHDLKDFEFIRLIKFTIKVI